MSVSGHPYINNPCYPVPEQYPTYPTYPTYPSNGYQYQNTQDTDYQGTKTLKYGNIECPLNSWENSNQASLYDQVHCAEHETLTELVELGKPCNKELTKTITLYLQTPCMTPPWTG
jgi:hypothetical protein